MNRFTQAAISVCLFAAVAAANGQASPAQAGATPGTTNSKTTGAAGTIDDPHAVVEKEILAELRQIRLLLQRQQQQQAQQANAPVPTAPPPTEKARVSTDGFEIGRKDAPITIVEFADYQCPYCKQFHNTVFDKLKKDYIDTGKVRFVSRDLPLDFHPNAFGAAQAARCAGAQDKYWEMRDTLIVHADNLAPDAIDMYANQAGLDMNRFHSCVKEQTYAAGIREDVADASAAGLSATPSFVIGLSNGNSVTGEKILGALPFENFQKILAGLDNQTQPALAGRAQ